MAEEDTGTSPEPEVTDEQVAEYFESGGDTPSEKTPAKEPIAEVIEDAKDEPTETKHVPLAALHEERAKRKELSAKMQAMEQRFQAMLESMKPAPPEAPKLDENPVANLDTRLAEIEAYKKSLEAQGQAHNAQQAQQAQWNALMTNYQTAAQAFAEKTTDFPDAYKYWTGARRAELEAGGYTTPEATHIMNQEEAAVVFRALQNEINPAEQMYKLAKVRGYKPSASGDDKIAQIDKGQKAKSLSGGGGKAPEGNTLEALAAMDDDEFEKNWDRIVGKM